VRIVFWDRTEFNLAVACLTSYLKEHMDNLDITIHSSNPYSKSFTSKCAQIEAQKILDLNPDIVLFSIFTDVFNEARSVATAIREMNAEVPIIAGGIHPTLAPEETFASGAYDCVFIGESEEPLRIYLSQIMKNELSLKTIPNMLYKDEVTGSIVTNNVLPYPHHLDTLPAPDYDHYARLFYGVLPYSTSRGCPYSCSYCSNSVMHDRYLKRPKRIRRKSVDRAIEELKYLIERHDIKRIFFFDDDFCYEEKWLKDFSEKYSRQIGLPFFIFSTPISLDENRILLLKKAGVTKIQIGLQSFNSTIRKEICNRPETDSQIENISALSAKHRIPIGVDIIFGLPGESVADAEESLWSANKLKFRKYSVYWLSLYPKTAIIDHCIQAGMIDPTLKKMLDRGEQGGMSSALGSFPKNNAPFLSVAILLTALPLLPDFLARFIISKRLYRFFPKSLATKQLLDLICAVIFRDRFLIAQAKRYFKLSYLDK